MMKNGSAWIGAVALGLSCLAAGCDGGADDGPSGGTGGGSGGSLPTGGTGGSTGGTGGGSGGSGTGGMGGSLGGDFSVENGLIESGPWSGYAFTVVDDVGGTITPECDEAGTAVCFTDAGSELCATGTLAASYESFALIGFSVNQEIDPVTFEGGEELPWATTGTGVTVGATNNGTTGMRVQLQSGEDRWCADLPAGGGTLLWGDFETECWAGTGTAFVAGDEIEQIQVQTFSPTETGETPFDFCVTNISLAE